MNSRKNSGIDRKRVTAPQSGHGSEAMPQEVMMKSKRIQRKRTKNWKMPENTVYVGRPSKWGNPFALKEWLSNEQAVELFTKAYMNPYSFYMSGEIVEHMQLIRDTIQDLRGKNLACWCPLDKPCHADVLLRLANEDK